MQSLDEYPGCPFDSDDPEADYDFKNDVSYGPPGSILRALYNKPAKLSPQQLTAARAKQLFDSMPTRTPDPVEQELVYDTTGFCPICKSFLDTKFNRKTGEKFTGCTSYPLCTYTRAETAGAPQATAPLGACPSCNAPLKLRTNRATHTSFVGCSRFPHCKYTRSS